MAPMRRSVGSIPARVNTGRPAHSGRGGGIQTPGLPGRNRLFYSLNYAPSNWNRRQELHPHHWVRSPGSFLLDDSGMVAGDGIEPPLPAYEIGLAPLQLSRNKLAATIRLSKIKNFLAQGEGLEPSPAGLESAMLPVTPTLRIQTWTRAEASTWRAPPGRRRSH